MYINNNYYLDCFDQDLLEKNRVVRQNPMERNFHIFYAMLAGATPEEKGQLKLGDPAAFHYLNQSGCVSDPTINDVEDFARVYNMCTRNA